MRGGFNTVTKFQLTIQPMIVLAPLKNGTAKNSTIATTLTAKISSVNTNGLVIVVFSQPLNSVSNLTLISASSAL